MNSLATVTGILLSIQVQGAHHLHEGVLQSVLHYLADHQILLEAVDYKVTNPPGVGLPRYSMRLRLEAPAWMSVPSLQPGLEAVARRLNVEAKVQEGWA